MSLYIYPLDMHMHDTFALLHAMTPQTLLGPSSPGIHMEGDLTAPLLLAGVRDSP